MAKPSTLSAEWNDLISTVGGITAICDTLDMSQTTFYRASRGMTRFPEDKQEALDILCDLYGVKNPLETQPPARSKDLTPLRMLGEALAQGFPPATRALDKLRKIYPQEQLLELADSDGTPEKILRAVTVLLEKT